MGDEERRGLFAVSDRNPVGAGTAHSVRLEPRATVLVEALTTHLPGPLDVPRLLLDTDHDRFKVLEEQHGCEWQPEQEICNGRSVLAVDRVPERESEGGVEALRLVVRPAG